ncbi:MAG TPA: hypothetical protein VGY94_07240 [Acidobacteriaceae bacterium]|jgi:hypothetical protein|nr:hypothetical protein [Acidobacteriaceae bacterium]
MRHPLAFSILVLSVAVLGAPASVAAPEPVTVSNPSACPVELSAEQHGAGSLVAAAPNTPAIPPRNANHPQQAIDLSMKNTRLQRIVGAELEVHGTSNKSRVMPASGAVLTNQPTADAVRNVSLASSVPADQTRMRTVTVNDLTSVAWISVIELRYADGSTWHARPGSECRVVPNGMMLIADK